MSCTYCFGSGVNPHATDLPCYPCEGVGVLPDQNKKLESAQHAAMSKYDRERLLIKQTEEILKLKERAKKVEKEMKNRLDVAESKIKRITDIAYSDKPVAFKVNRIRQVVKETPGRDGSLGKDLY